MKILCTSSYRPALPLVPCGVRRRWRCAARCRWVEAGPRFIGFCAKKVDYTTTGTGSGTGTGGPVPVPVPVPVPADRSRSRSRYRSQYRHRDRYCAVYCVYISPASATVRYHPTRHDTGRAPTGIRAHTWDPAHAIVSIHRVAVPTVSQFAYPTVPYRTLPGFASTKSPRLFRNNWRIYFTYYNRIIHV